MSYVGNLTADAQRYLNFCRLQRISSVCQEGNFVAHFLINFSQYVDGFI